MSITSPSDAASIASEILRYVVPSIFTVCAVTTVVKTATNNKVILCLI